MFEDTFEDTLKEMQKADFSILNGITYFGRKNVQEHASRMYALIFDLDGVTEETLGNFFYSAFNKDHKIYPIPNYVILSGHGVHLYYLFEEPVPLYPNIKLQLKELKYALTFRMWNKYTSKKWNKVQYQGINQGFRVIGGKTKVDGMLVRAFKISSHPYSLSQLNEYVPKESRIDENKLWKESKLTIEQAKGKYPVWYEKRVIQGQEKGTWTCKRDLYEWWKEKILSGASVGHRYFCVMCLAVYGVKSGVSKDQVEKDALEIMEFLEGMTDSEDNHFDEMDVKDALECYDERYITFPINDISKISGIEIQKNKRNGRKQNIHLKLARNQLAMLKELGETSQGRKKGSGSKEDLIREYISKNEYKSVTEISKALGVSRPTVYKYLGKG